MSVIHPPVFAVGDDGAAGVIGGSRCHPSFPKLTLADRGFERRSALGHRLVDGYLELVAARLRPNSTLAVAYDLKVFFTVVAKDPLEVRRAPMSSAFVRAQRTGATVTRRWCGSATGRPGWRCRRCGAGCRRCRGSTPIWSRSVRSTTTRSSGACRCAPR